MSRIALIGENSVEYVSKLLDIWNNGDCAVLIDWRVPIITIYEMLKEAEVQKCFISSNLHDIYDDISSRELVVETFEVLSHRAITELTEDIYAKYKENYAESEALIIYSSGTTGRSNGVILSHFAINTNADAIINYMKPSDNDCIYVVKTISHASTIVGEVLVSLKTHTKLVLGPIVVPPRYILQHIAKFNATIICINPTLLKLIMHEYDKNEHKYNLSSLSDIYVHGAKNAYEDCLKAKRTFCGINIYYEYGLSEAGPRVATQRISSNTIDSVGKPINNVRIAVVNDNGEVESENKYGVIHVDTPTIYSGYVKGRMKFQSKYSNWLNTGDVGYLDEYGELHVVDRIDEIINVDAHKIYPSDVESKIVMNTNIDECVVVKVDYSDQEILACLYTSSKKITKDLKKELGMLLMKYEIPRIFVRVDSIPKTSNGKVARKMSKDILMNKIMGDRDERR